MRLENQNDFSLDFAKRTVSLTDAGQDAIYREFSQRPEGRLARPWSQLIEQALRAEYLLHRDDQYVLQDQKVSIVDPNTGRIHEDRKWRAGLHQAVEIKEGLVPSAETQTQARVTRQRFTRLYDHMCGMTGTALDARSEFQEFYELNVAGVPTHRPCRRERLATRWYTSASKKFESGTEKDGNYAEN